MLIFIQNITCVKLRARVNTSRAESSNFSPLYFRHRTQVGGIAWCGYTQEFVCVQVAQTFQTMVWDG